MWYVASDITIIRLLLSSCTYDTVSYHACDKACNALGKILRTSLCIRMYMNMHLYNIISYPSSPSKNQTVLIVGMQLKLPFQVLELSVTS